MEGHLLFPIELLKNFHIIWTFFLVMARFTAMMLVIPGLGEGYRGLRIRLPGILVLSYAAVVNGPYAAVPADWVEIAAAFASELMLGMILATVPAMIVAGAQTAAQLSTNTMGLGASQLFDPASGIAVTSLGKLFGNFVVCCFLLIGGHHVVIYAVSGLGGTIVPGTFLLTENSIGLLVQRTADIFVAGVMISAPVIVAILLTKFVMGLISRAVPQVNIFIVSFPLTIGIGLILSMFSLPEILQYVEKDFKRMEQDVLIITGGAQQVAAPGQASDPK